jgi:DtxR family Mn-dependent transcriptional regulator
MNNISKENYLSAIYKHGNEKGTIKANQIAEILEISNAAVTDMLKKLSKEGYVDYERYKGITLTDEGEQYAKNMVRRHRIWEVFLHKVVGLPWDKVHCEAEMLEHSSSDELINRLEEILDFPEYDPHGDPIPDKNGKLPEKKSGAILASIEPGKTVKVIKVNDFDSSFLNYISSIGIKLNKEIKVTDVLEFDNSILIEVADTEKALSSKMASNIFVTELNEYHD